MTFKPEEFTANGSEYIEIMELTAIASGTLDRSRVPEINAYRMFETALRHGLLRTVAAVLEQEGASAWFSVNVLTFARESLKRRLDGMAMDELCSLAGDPYLPESFREMVEKSLDRKSSEMVMRKEHKEFIGRMPRTPRLSHLYSIVNPGSPRIRYMQKGDRPSRRPRSMTPAGMKKSSLPPGRYSVKRSGIRMNRKRRDSQHRFPVTKRRQRG